MLLKGKTAIITGSNRGIGSEILKLFSENGCNIISCSRNITQEFIISNNKLEKEFQNEINEIDLDLSDSKSVNNAIGKIKSYETKIDCIINNAGEIHNKLFQMTKIDEAKYIFEVNFFNQIFFTQGLIRKIDKKKGGSIIFLSSSSAQDGNIGRSIYAASKSAIEAFSKVLSRELGSSKIRVNSISPGLTNTEMMIKSTDKKYLENIVNDIPLKRIGEKIDVAKLALFLASDLSSYLTGQNIRIDGGLK